MEVRLDNDCGDEDEDSNGPWVCWLLLVSMEVRIENDWADEEEDSNSVCLLGTSE